MYATGTLPERAREALARDSLLAKYCLVGTAPQDAVGLADLPELAERDRVELVVRPVVITVRSLLAVGAVPVGEPRVDLVTGRVVVPDLAAAEPARTAEAINRLHRALTAISPDTEHVVAEELRFCSAGLLSVLAGDHAWRRFAHHVPSAQDEVLQRVLRLVKERASAHRRNPDVPRPLVALDLDFCAFHPRTRVREALAALGVTEPLPVLPGLYEPGWRPFRELACLPEALAHADFRRAISWDDEALLTDELAPGVRRFTGDVAQAGGRVVLLTGRRHRMRAATERALARHDLGHLELRTTDEGADVGRQKVAALRGMTGWEPVAAFDDKEANRVALQEEFPQAVVVPVAAPGFTGVDEPDAIATFETVPQPVPLGRGHASGPGLSHATSIAQLRLDAMRTRPTLWWRGVRLTEDEQVGIVTALCRGAEETGARLGDRVAAIESGSVRAIWQIMQAKLFGASRSAYPVQQAEEDLSRAVAAGEPAELVLLGPPTKQDGSRLKALGGLPDLAEVAMLARLLQLDTAVRRVHPPGIRVTALADPSHFRAREERRYGGYQREFRRMLELTGAGRIVEVRNVDEVAAEFGCGDAGERAELLEQHRERYRSALAGLDVRTDPRGALAEADERDPGCPGQPRFAEMFRSIVHAVDVPRAGGDPVEFARRVYAEPFDLTDPDLAGTRRELLALAWDETITYLSNKHVDVDLDYAALWRRDRVRMSLSLRPEQGRFRFVPLGGSAVMPWQGTAALGRGNEVSTDFAISLIDQCYLPVWAPEGHAQPWFMVPPDLVRGGVLLPEVRDGIQLRSK
ncbi:L-tyrosine/L-tryptophan isonitrile synthase family protein [Saccharopolyspora sp. TS4A08]|uniref:L-tyrosine/L-tryptophan isonitrile synthase family protein n=1 Tax=Saccharopolyspora ipomoeae TaxID=3042027 RepID=A0ABT6PXE0_9PSEU|nr:L-tyrosine/L-tryptophan isonitrile synthase family protein [Saccharopolyspora sp. TS4A08]MDI2032667.1 L-tyrosine/L-tryptophan isonitrile synthase family protein [Saccharopolyspora sp. TS4A08]